MKLDGALDAEGQPTRMAWPPGLYFAGLDFASTRNSGIVLVTAEEAPRLVDRIAGPS
jgi:putative flavoprotein involved in K+ transport